MKEVKEVIVQLPLAEANNYLNFVSMVLEGSDLLKPIASQYIQMIKRNNEENLKQPNE